MKRKPSILASIAINVGCVPVAVGMSFLACYLVAEVGDGWEWYHFATQLWGLVLGLLSMVTLAVGAIGPWAARDLARGSD